MVIVFQFRLDNKAVTIQCTCNKNLLPLTDLKGKSTVYIRKKKENPFEVKLITKMVE